MKTAATTRSTTQPLDPQPLGPKKTLFVMVSTVSNLQKCAVI